MTNEKEEIQLMFNLWLDGKIKTPAQEETELRNMVLAGL